MALKDKIYKIRTNAKLSQEQFAAVFNVSRQSVQRWENGSATPELSKVTEISKHFNVSLDYLLLDRDTRTLEDMNYGPTPKPHYSNIHDWEFYTSDILTEYRQSIEEGLDIEEYKEMFEAVAKMPKNGYKKKFGDVLFDIVIKAKQREGYKYVEPSDLAEIKALRNTYNLYGAVNKSTLEDKLYGAWMGRICGCMLGKPIEGIKTEELIPLLKDTGNYPLQRYIYRSDLTEGIIKRCEYALDPRDYADEIDGMPVDDDTNYVVLAQALVEKYGRDFTPADVASIWLELQPKSAYCTAERVAFRNFVAGYEPPQSAIYQNPYREWIGAQIRGDYFGYINPGNPELAAEMAWRDASISHVKNGIYGEMFISAMLAVAAVTNNIEEIIFGGLAQIPQTSRLYEAIVTLINEYKKGVTQKECFANIHKMYDEHNMHDWCHTISNALIVVASLLYGEGDYAKSICMAVETGFDTDCNGATVGSILGMANGIDSIPEYWKKPINDTLHTSIFGVDTVKISECAKKTMKHLA